jgi:plastocyanin
MATALRRTTTASGRLRRWGIATKLAGVFAIVLMALASDVAASAATTPATTGPIVRIINMGTNCTSLFCFKPGKIVITAGTTLTWKNRTAVSHTVTRCTVAACGVDGGTGKDQGFGSGVIPPGGKYTFTFQTKGTYIYYCAIHGYGIMHGRVVLMVV